MQVGLGDYGGGETGFHVDCSAPMKATVGDGVGVGWAEEGCVRMVVRLAI